MPAPAMIHGMCWTRVGERVAVVDAPVVAELLAVIGHDDDQRVRQLRIVRAQRRNEAADLLRP